MFDKRRFASRDLTDDAPVPAAAADPWALADVKIVRALAQRSAADLADALTNTPEAVAGTAVALGRRSTSVPRGPRRSRPRAGGCGQWRPRPGMAATAR